MQLSMPSDTYVCISFIFLFRINITARWRRNIICTQDRSITLVYGLTRCDRESFDLPSFFQLHDLNRCVHHRERAFPFTLKITSDGVWDSEEVEAIYGVHHVYSQKKSKVSYNGRAL
jgi:hypothetical protein